MTAFTTPTPLELGDRAERACQTVLVCQANNPAICEFFVRIQVSRGTGSPGLKARTLHVRIRPGFSSFAAVERAGDRARENVPARTADVTNIAWTTCFQVVRKRERRDANPRPPA